MLHIYLGWLLPNSPFSLEMKIIVLSAPTNMLRPSIFKTDEVRVFHKLKHISIKKAYICNIYVRFGNQKHTSLLARWYSSSLFLSFLLRLFAFNRLLDLSDSE